MLAYVEVGKVSLGSWVRHRRHVLGLTQEQVTERMDGRSSTWISRIERDVRRELPTPEEVAMLAIALECSQADILRAAGYAIEEDASPSPEPWGYEPLTDTQQRLIREIAEQFRTGHDE